MSSYNTNKKDDFGNTALMKIAQNCTKSNEKVSIEIAKLLIDYNANINIKNNKGETAIILTKNKKMKELLSSYTGKTTTRDYGNYIHLGYPFIY